MKISLYAIMVSAAIGGIILSIAAGVYVYSLPQPVVIDATQISGYPQTYIDVTVKNNGRDGQVTVYIEYQFDIDHLDKIRTESRTVYMLTGETTIVQFTLNRTSTEYNLPSLSKAYV